MKTRKLITIIAVSITFSLIMFNMAIIAIAFPYISKDLVSLKLSEQWIINSYILSLVTFSLIVGKLCDIYNTKKIIIIGLILFGLGSFGCFLANNFNIFIFFRAIQGVASACMITPATKFLSDIFSTKKFGKAIGLTTGYASIGMMLSPVLGGITIQHFGWRWIFIINIFLCIISILSFLTIRIKEENKNKLILSDVNSFILIAMSLFSLVFAIMEGPSLKWFSKTINILISVSVISFILLIINESYKKKPLFNFNKIITFNCVISNIIIIFTEALSISLIFLIMYMHATLMISASNIGFLILPFYILIVISGFFSGYWINNTGPYKPLLYSGFIIILGYAISFFLISEKNYLSILPIIICMGLGLQVLINASKTIVINSAKKKYKGLAIGLQSNSRDLSATISFAIFASIISYYKILGHKNNTSLDLSFYDGFNIIIFLCLIFSIIISLLSILIFIKNKNKF